MKKRDCAFLVPIRPNARVHSPECLPISPNEFALGFPASLSMCLDIYDSIRLNTWTSPEWNYARPNSTHLPFPKSVDSSQVRMINHSPKESSDSAEYVPGHALLLRLSMQWSSSLARPSGMTCSVWECFDTRVLSSIMVSKPQTHDFGDKKKVRSSGICIKTM